MNIRKKITLGLIAVFALTSLAACSKDKVSTESTTAAQSSSTIIGKVTDINGTTITLALGEMPGGGPGKDWGSMPSGTPDGNNKNGGNSKDQRPGGMNGFFNETGETKTIEVTDESLINLMSADGETTGSLKDISVDSILTVQYSDDGTTINAIIVQGNFDNAAAPDNKNKRSF